MQQPQSSSQGLIQQIKDARSLNNGAVPWDGDNGFENILLRLAQQIRDRSLLTINTIAGLGNINANDTGYVFVRNSGLYKYDPNGGNNAPGSVPAQGGGRWLLLAQLGSSEVQYSEVIGDGGQTSFEVTHNLNTYYPTVSIFNTVVQPYTPMSTGFTYVVDDANTIVLSFVAAPSNQSKTVVVKR